MFDATMSIHAQRGAGLPNGHAEGDSGQPLKSADGRGGPQWHPARILLVEDDATMRGMVASYLEKHNLRVVPVTHAAEAIRRSVSGDVDLVLLDLVLGGEDGLDVLRGIRRQSNVPLIIVTGHRRDEAAKVEGLELGADDYVTKPFSVRELLARIKAVLRRHAASRNAAAQRLARGRCRFGGWQFECRTRRLRSPDGTVLELTRSESALLSAFLGAPQLVLSREYLLQATRPHADVFDRSIDVQILRLRRKLEANPDAERIIRTERGIGYAWTLPVEWLA